MTVKSTDTLNQSINQSLFTWNITNRWILRDCSWKHLQILLNIDCKHSERQNGHSHIFLSQFYFLSHPLPEVSYFREEIFPFFVCSSESLQPVALPAYPSIFNEISPCSRDRIHHSRFKIIKKNSPNISKPRCFWTNWEQMCVWCLYLFTAEENWKSRKKTKSKHLRSKRSHNRHPVWGQRQTWPEHKLNVFKKKKLTSAFWIPFIQAI